MLKLIIFKTHWYKIRGGSVLHGRMGAAVAHSRCWCARMPSWRTHASRALFLRNWIESKSRFFSGKSNRVLKSVNRQITIVKTGWTNQWPVLSSLWPFDISIWTEIISIYHCMNTHADVLAIDSTPTSKCTLKFMLLTCLCTAVIE